MEPIDKMINDHWDYTWGLIRAAMVSTCERDEALINAQYELCEGLYKGAWIHGVKHERERVAEKRKRINLKELKFEGFGKIPRLNRDCTITEKVDGTEGHNANCDNQGFVKWGV